MQQVTAGLIVFNGRLLLAKRPLAKKLGGQWEFPGGKVETGEELREALRRELWEELRLNGRIGRKYCETVHSYPFGTLCLHAYWVQADSEAVQLTEHDACVWVGPQELAEYDVTSADREIVTKLRRQFKQWFRAQM